VGQFGRNYVDTASRRRHHLVRGTLAPKKPADGFKIVRVHRRGWWNLTRVTGSRPVERDFELTLRYRPGSPGSRAIARHRLVEQLATNPAPVSPDVGKRRPVGRWRG